MNNKLSIFHHSSINKYFICLILFLLGTGFVLEQAHATANYVYHERSTNNPGCGGQFVSNLTPGSADAVTVRFKVEYQYYTDNARLYYTTDGTNPSGAYGTPSGTTQVVTANWVCLFNAGQNVDVWEAAIPAQQGGKTVKYIISAWHSGGGSEIFANSGEFVNPFTTSSQATQFSYSVTCPTISVSPASLSSGTVGSSYSQSVTASGGTSSYTYAVTTGTLPAGLTLASNGTLSGTPTTSGTSNFTITATDANGCTGSKAYTVYVFPSIPTITSFTPTTGVSGTSVTITGTNFDATASNNVVYFGGVQASVTAASSTSLTVLSPLGAMYAPITVTVNGKTAMSRARFNPTFTPSGTLNTATFSSPVSFATSMATYNYPAVGDIDGDGKLDVLQISNSGGKFMVFRNTSTAGTISSGSFDAEVAVSTGSSPRSIHVADIDGDGKLDAVVICGAYAASLTIHRNTSTPGSISFSSGVSHYAGGSISGGCGIGDLNADGKPDIAYADGSNSVYIYTNTSTPGTIAMTYATAVSNLYAPDIAITDVDGDGKHDLILAHSSNDTVYVYRNTITSSTLSFDSPVRLYGKGAYLAVGDVDGDGLSDIITSGWSGKFGILQNTSTSGNISFSARTTFTAETYPNYPHLGDLTGDGKPDVFTPGWGTNNLAIYPNTSSSGVINGSSLGSRVMYSGGVDYNVNSGGLADFDGDGRFDILALKDNSFVIMRNQLGNTYTISANAVGGGTVSPSGVTNVSHYANQAYSITANANYRIDSVVTDGTNRGAISSYTFTNVIANHTITAYFSYVCPTITVSPSTLSNGTAGSSYSETITASGGTSPYTYAVSTGTLPGGLGLTTAGVLSGTPSGAGTSNFTVTATDANGCTGSLAYALTVSVACDTGATLDQQQLVTSSGSLAIQAGQIVAQTFTAGLSGTLQRIALYLGKQNGYDFTTSSTLTAGDLIIEMQSTVSSTTNSFGGNCGTITRNAPSGTVLATMTVPNSSVALGGGQFYTFDFPTPISLTSGEIYAIVVRNTGIQPVDGNPGRFDWYEGRLNGGITDPYIGGASLAKQTAASTWSIFEAVQPNSCNFTVYDDMAFKTYIGMGISLSPGSLSNGTVGSAYSQTITASNGASPYTFAVTSGSLPAGLTLSNAGELSGTPTAAGTSNFTVTATDANGCTGNKSYSLAVACPTITITPSSLSGPVKKGVAFSQTYSASGGTAPYTFVVLTGTLPTGLTLTSAGVLSGTPTVVGNSDYTVQVTDSNGCTATIGIHFVVDCADLVLDQQTNPTGTAGTAFSLTFSVTGNATGSFTYDQPQGTLPPGLSLSAAGVLSGTPTTGGNYTFTIRATDSAFCSTAHEYTMNVGCPTITLSPSTLANGTQNSAYSATITASGGANPYTFAVSTGSIPAGLTLSTAGLLSGTPSAAGESNFTVIATDSNGCTGSLAYTLTVSAACDTGVTLDQQQASTNGGYSNAQAGYTLAQTFTASHSGALKQVALSLGKSNGYDNSTGQPVSPGDLIIQLRTTQSGTADSYGGNCGQLTRLIPSETVLATITVPAAATLTGTYTFPNPANITSGQTYAIVIYNNGIAPANGSPGYYNWYQTSGGSDVYTGGMPFTNNPNWVRWSVAEAVMPNSCNFTNYNDFVFSTYVSSGISVSPASVSGGTVGVAYNQTFTASNGASPYTFAVTSGSLPAGLTLSNAGELSGTPTVAVTSNFTVTATDANGCTGSQGYTLVVQAPRPGSISGMKWNDADGDGVKDAEEQGIQNWNIYLTGAKIDSTLTDAEGHYSFNGLSAGEYTVREETREGWAQTYPESVTHIVVLTAGEDANQKNFGNKVTEETTPPFTYTTPEILDGQDEFCTPLIMNRNYTASETWFVKAKGGDLGVTLYAHAVNNVDPESVFVQVFNASSTLVTEFGVGYTAGEVSSAGIGFEKSIMVNIGGRTPGEILRFVVTTPSPTPATQPHYRFHFGRVVSAALNSPSFPGFEEEYARWYVNVLPSEDLNLDFFTTDMPTPADTMVVRVVGPSGAYHASSGMYTVGGTTEINVPGASSGVWSVEVEHINGHYRVNKTTGTDRGIYVGQFSGGCGVKIVNLTQNGSPSTGLPVGITINRQVATPAGLQYVAKDSVFTDSSSFRFDKLPSGFYKIDVRPMSPGYTTPVAQYDTVMCDSVLVNTFNFNSNTGRITGMKFEDTNGNGVKDENEHGIPNWEIFLNGEAFMASTDTNGHYEFNNLVAGTYIVSEVSAEGWIQTFPGDPGTYTVELTPGATISEKNFGNKRDCSIACAPDTTLYMPSNGCTVSGVTLTPPSIDGICEIISSTNNAPTDFSLGTTTVEWTVTVAGGAVYTCNQVVTVLDTIKPTVVCSPNLNVSADENQCGANVNFTFGATDNCPGVMTTASHTSGSFFGLGTTTVTVIAADSAGNSDTCSFTVTVTDTHPPVVICPANMNVYATSEAGAVVNFSVSGTDNCPGVMTSTNPPSGSLFPIGATTVISIATDSSGNADTCSFTINVLAAPAMISGMKYEDADGDGVKDAGEVGLQGWVISLTGSATALDTTDGSGNYSFTNLAAGTYTVREVVKSGWVQTTANPADITLAMGDTVSGVNFGNFHLPVISGMKFNDLNGNGVKDNGESGLANWIIKAVKGVTTKFDTTDANGEYSFSFTLAQLGTWVISEELQSGWAQTFPAGGTYSIALVSGTNSTNTDFGNQQFSSISGSKYDDFDGDSVTSGDAKLSGWVIKLFKNNAIVSRTTTNGSGDYTFTNLTPGTYVVQESLRVGWIQTYPSVSNSVPAVDDVNEGPRAYSVTITSGSVITGKDFANFKLGTLSGVKFLDYNGDSLKNAGELGLEQWEIILTKGETAFDTAYTDAQGNYQFTNLLAANYTVSETGREGWYQTTPASGSYIITVSSGTTETSLNFGNFEYGSISGVKFFDRDSSGTKDPTCETILPGTKIVLVGPHATADTLTTDANGEFTFTNVPAGVFTLKEGNNPNWNQTYPANGASYSITMVSGLDSAGLTFGNFYMPDTAKFRTFILSDYAKSSRAKKKSGFISNPTAGNVRDTVFINRGFGLDNQNDSGYLRIGIRRPDSSLVYGWFFHRWSIYKGPAVKHWIYNTKAWGLKRNPKTKTYVQRNPAFYLGIVGEQTTETYFGNAGNHLTMELTTLKTNIAASDLGITPRGLGDLLFVCRDNTADSVFNGMTVRKIVSIADTMLTMGRKIVNVSASQIDTTYRCDVPYLALLDSTLARINNEFRSTATKIDTISTKPLKLKGVKGLYKVSYLMRDSIAPIPLAHFDPVYSSSNGEPEEFKLEQNYPNPFNPTTTLSFVIGNQSLVTLKIYNLLGQEVATLFDKQDMEAGMQEVEFNGANLASGVYFYRLTATSGETGTVNTDVKRMIMIK